MGISLTQDANSAQSSEIGNPNLASSTLSTGMVDSDKSTSTQANINSDDEVAGDLSPHEIAAVFRKSDYKCERVGRFANPTSCTKYYYCWNDIGLAYEFTCPEHKAFDPVNQLCVANYGVCAIASKCKENKQIMINPENKWTFFECILLENDTAEFNMLCRPCAEAREFDVELGYCKLISGSLTLESDEMECTEIGLHIDYEDETKYFDCVVKSVARGILKSVHHKCPRLHLFSFKEKKCVPISKLVSAKPQ